MARLIGFFVLVFILSRVLGFLPIVGPFLDSSCFGLWISALLLSWMLSRYGERAVRIRRDGVQIRQLVAVDTPHSNGKIGALLLAQGRTRKAIPHLERAAAGEPDVADWSYRLGCARFEAGDREGALTALRQCVELDEEHAYGVAQMRLAEALGATGHAADSLAALETFERNHGPSPESAFRRGVAHRAVGAKDEARAAFGEVSRLAAESAHYQRKSAGLWSLRARVAALF